MRATGISVSFVASDVIQLRLDLGKVRDARNRERPPDDIDPADAEPESGWVWHDDAWAGRVTPGGTWMATDRYIASPLDPLFDLSGPGGDRRAPVDAPQRWSVSVNGEEASIAQILRKSQIRDTAETGWFTFDFATTQDVFLKLDAPLESGERIAISFDHPRWDTVEAAFAPDRTVSEAIHVNLAGFAPGDLHKTAYLSSWNGRVLDGATEAEAADAPQDYPEGLRFRVIDEATGKVAFRGRTELSAAADAPTDFTRNFAGTDVFAMDFSALDTPGTYHLRLPGIGRSPSFEIAGDHWDAVFDLSLSGFYHQRSGLALTEAFTDWTHPRALHPADGRITVQETTVPLSATDQGFDTGRPSPFDLLPAKTTGRELKQAWGGWHDAGDWDRRTQHLEASRKLAELVELAPDWAADAGGNLPESRNRLPDALDEAIWGAAIFARLQRADGGVRGGVEGENYAGYGSASWTEERTFFAYAPDAWTSWEFAATAAKFAHLLEDIAPKKAARWLDRAERAMDWAEANAPADPGEEEAFVLATSRSVAAVELYRATGETAYHDIFLDSTTYRQPADSIDFRAWQWESAFVYSTLPEDMVRPAVAARARDALLDHAGFLLEEGTRSGFGFVDDPYSPYGWGDTAQQPGHSADILARAHVLTGDDRYLEAMQADVQYALGANPRNMTYLTGLTGARGPESILNGDGDAMGGAVLPGITLYGDHSIHDFGQGFYHDVMWPDLWPDPWRTPFTESFQAFDVFVPSTEYTVMQGLTDMTFVTGYLAAHEADLLA